MAVVAKNGDVEAIPSMSPVPGTTPSPGWSAEPVQYTGEYPNLKTDGSKVIFEAKCNFTYTGTTPPPASAPYSTTSTVTLKASSTLLQKGSTYVLKVGDSNTDDYGNMLQVKSVSNTLKTS